MTLPIISCSGPALTVGYTHGRLARSQISNSLQTYRALFHSMAGLSWDRVLKLAEEFERSLAETYPELVDEMRGVAEGAGVEVTEIVALNCRSEIALTAPMDGCTAFSWKMGGEQWLAQNWDWKPAIKDSLIVLDIAAHGERPAMKFVTEAGIIGKIGLNEHGLSLTLNALRTPSLSPTLPPIHLFLRLLLQQPTFSSARALISSLPGLASAAHILIASPDGAVGVECTPQGFAFLEPDERGMVHHTNHLLTQELKEQSGERPLWEDSGPRLERVRELSWEAVGQDPSVEGVRRVLSDRKGGRTGICRADGDREGGSDTLFCIVMDCTRKRAEVKVGRPDEDGEVVVLEF